MSKNKKVMSIAIKPELHDDLKRFSKRKGLSASTYIGNLIEQAVKLNIDDDPMVIGRPVDDEVVPVVLKIPLALKSNPDKLKQWMEVQASGIVKAMSKLATPSEEVAMKTKVTPSGSVVQLVDGEGNVIGEQG